MQVKQLATVDQFQVRLGRDLYKEEIPRVEAILQDTTAVAMGAAQASWTPATVPGDVVAVLLSASLRTFKNPDRYIQQAIGDYSARVSDGEFASGLFTKAELDVLERNSEAHGFTHGSFGTMTATRDECWGPRVDYWETNRPTGPTPWSIREEEC